MVQKNNLNCKANCYFCQNELVLKTNNNVYTTLNYKCPCKKTDLYYFSNLNNYDLYIFNIKYINNIYNIIYISHSNELLVNMLKDKIDVFSKDGYTGEVSSHSYIGSIIVPSNINFLEINEKELVYLIKNTINTKILK